MDMAQVTSLLTATGLSGVNVYLLFQVLKVVNSIQVVMSAMLERLRDLDKG